MTRQHFQAQADLCADIISELQNRDLINEGDVLHASIVDSFCDMCGRNNPKFDRLRFNVWVQNILDEIKNK